MVFDVTDDEVEQQADPMQVDEPVLEAVVPENEILQEQVMFALGMPLENTGDQDVIAQQAGITTEEGEELMGGDVGIQSDELQVFDPMTAIVPYNGVSAAPVATDLMQVLQQFMIQDTGAQLFHMRGP